MPAEKQKIIITGVSGLLGNNLAYYFRDKHKVLGLYNEHPVVIEGVDTERADLLSEGAFSQVVKKFHPDIIIHCASLTNVDYCETNREITQRINVGGTQTVLSGLNGLKTKFVYISTDSVYEGTKGNYSESDETNPLNYYGKSKLEGERVSLEYNNALVLRTNIFGWNIQNKNSLSEWLFDELSNKRPISCFSDAYFSSIYTFELACVMEKALYKNLVGIYNCASSTSLSKYEFAIKFADCFGLNKSLINPISIDKFGFKAKRGKNLSVNVNKLANDIGCRLPKMEDCIIQCHSDFTKDLPKKIKEPRILSYGRQYIDEADIAAVVEVLKAPYLTKGPKVMEFETALCKITGAKYAVAVNSGTSALHIACMAADIKEGDEVLTSPNTFVASANCAVYCSAKPVFADIDTRTFNILPSEIGKKISDKTKAIIPVDFAGQSCDMSAIWDIKMKAEKKFGRKVYIIEDACHAIGSTYKGQNVGSCVFSDMTVMSFHPVKHITTGEGGAVLTNDEGLYQRLRILRSHGIAECESESYAKYNKDDRNAPWYYEQIDLGYNYRITDIQCALGLSQLDKLPLFIKKRRELVNQYNLMFNGVDLVRTPYESGDGVSNFHLYVLLVDFEKTGINRSAFMAELKKNGIQTQVHYIPVYTQPYYQEKFGCRWGDCPNAEDYYKTCLSIPLFPAMSPEDVKKVSNEVINLLK